jgi:bla regulator protein blaR1
MTSADWFSTLWRMLTDATLAGSLSIGLVFAVRRRFREAFGVSHAYMLWGLVPVAMLAVLPSTTTHIDIVPASVAVATLPLRIQLAQLPVNHGMDLRVLLCAAWLGGALIAAIWLTWQQRQFRRSLGRLQTLGPCLRRAETTMGLPATIGCWRPQVILPADFESKYSRAQRALILEHERAHIARGDLQANLLAAGMHCLYWFNPLVHLAIRCFRHDQELACDAHVVRRHPDACRGYGELLMQVQVDAQPSPLGCHFGFAHPLKERISMLKQPFPSTLRRFAGLALVAAMVSGVGMGARAMAPEAGTNQLIDVRMNLQVDGKPVADPRVISRSGKTFSVSDGTYLFEMTATVRPDGRISLASKPTWKGEPLGEIKVDLVDGKQEAFDFRAPRGAGTVVLLVNASTAPERVVLPSAATR